MQDGAAASKDEQQDEAQQEGLERVTQPATGISRVENGTADLTHSADDVGSMVKNATTTAH
ncbi:MAG: hypothetical protein ACOCT8_04630 [Actinomycetota bacterium]